MKFPRLIGFVLIAMLVSFLPPQQALAQTATPPDDLLEVLETMTPEERVGQLFLVNFTGTETEVESQIYDLIVNYHVGGVVLQSKNDNFSPAPDTITDLHQLIDNLQRLEWESALAGSLTEEPSKPVYIPLFVGIEQDGDGYPTDQILNGVTAIPNAMALGATWNPELVSQIATIQGQELAALGINLYLGPSLDVLESPNASARSDIGARSFGGDPYWVGEMGRAFISGLHTGSNGRILVIPKHFPGLGGSDRPTGEEVATVRKSLEQLKQIELAPFFAVTGDAPDSTAMADGVLVSYIRFQGLQGNIRATTRPISFDQQALGEMLALPELSGWRDEGGLVISGNLGSRAVYTFYAPADEGFSPELVARDAFRAGNDLLYLGNITSSEAGDTYTTTVDILEFFTRRYREDLAFAQLVDEAVTRILVRKNQLYGRFLVSNILVPERGLTEIGQSQQPVFEVARSSATLISPNTQELTSIFPSPPALRDRLVFITDVVQYAQCSTCAPNFSLSVNALQDAIVRLYGPTAGGQVSAARLNSYSLDDLAALLNEADVATMEEEINRADWIILALADSSLGQPDLISRFLSERQDLLRDKKIVLFAFTAPYYLDATDISKMSAYFSLYSKQPAFVDVAARLLYQELTPLGFSPVSIPGTGYDLIEVTRPDPEQIISLSLDVPPASDTTATGPGDQLVTPEPTPIPLLRIGDTVYIRTGEIFDHNGHIVPDGTVVKFEMVLSGEGGGIIQQLDQITTRGVARASFALEKPGLVEIRASSDPADLSEVIQIDVTSEEAAVVTVIAPIPSETVEPTPVAPTPVSENQLISEEGVPRFSGWLLVMIFVLISAWFAYWMGRQLFSHLWGWRWGICTALGGLVGYNYVVLGMPGGTQLALAGGILGVLGITGFGELLGLIAVWIWSRIVTEPVLK